ncbi:hypothetical protein, conserved in T. vivax [Trypanosoma vivax Y486]|uniref:Uncharacterized protein n=1 Tax=Trypanosoma vivax (strain Y486) TaxID=1055687 RepID=F9WLK2_TRYVY|nr:hypothetical protein, conserved in T. vivax [Trypanosoma vivax Y486]|eukprot:CCD18394.1 hypothetical protein, conserved in T. vivax [Trypanosoma vivax Y486]
MLRNVQHRQGFSLKRGSTHANTEAKAHTKNACKGNTPRSARAKTHKRKCAESHTTTQSKRNHEEKTRGHPTDSQDATCKHQRGACSLTGIARQQHGPRIKTAEKHTHIGTAAPRFGKANSDKNTPRKRKRQGKKHAITTGKPDKGWRSRTHARTPTDVIRTQGQAHTAHADRKKADNDSKQHDAGARTVPNRETRTTLSDAALREVRGGPRSKKYDKTCRKQKAKQQHPAHRKHTHRTNRALSATNTG